MSKTGKFHISDSNKVVACDATKRACPKKNFNSRQEAVAELHRREKIAQSSTPFVQPGFGGSYYAGVEYDYDYYGRSEWSDPDDPYSVYEGLHLKSVDAYSAVAGLIQCQGELPDELQKMIEDNNWNDISEWDIEAENDYYGQSVLVVPPRGMEEKLTQWYWNLPNADDGAGVLRYVRAKGVDTSGLTPVEAIKKQLAAENNGIEHPLLEKVNNASVTSVRLRDVVIPNREWFDKVEPRSVKAGGDSYPVTGVVVFVRNQYVLIDGYHRTKDVFKKSENSRVSPYCDYIILHEIKKR